MQAVFLTPVSHLNIYLVGWRGRGSYDWRTIWGMALTCHWKLFNGRLAQRIGYIYRAVASACKRRVRRHIGSAWHIRQQGWQTVHCIGPWGRRVRGALRSQSTVQTCINRCSSWGRCRYALAIRYASFGALILMGWFCLENNRVALDFDDSNTTAKTAVCHRTAQLPRVSLRIVHFNCFEIWAAVEATDGIYFARDNCQPNLFTNVYSWKWILVIQRCI